MGFLGMQGGALPGTSYTVTGASWTSGSPSYVTLTLGTHAIKTGQQVGISGALPAGYNNGGATAQVTAVTSTTIQFTLTTNPGTWTSGGTVLVSGAAPFSNQIAVDQYNHIVIWNGSAWTTPTGATVDSAGDIILPGYLSIPSQPHCLVRRAAALSIPSGTATYIPWDTDAINAQAMHSTTSNPQNLIAVQAGDYLVGCSILMGYSTSQIYGLLYVNGADTGVRFLSGNESSGNAVLTLCYPWHFNQGDVAALYILQSSGSSIALTVGAYSTAFMYKIL
ncbi:MAG: hypothetical protein ABSH09_33745 [Bryobacteraceae bacterium]